jgi:hypothetical protein
MSSRNDDLLVQGLRAPLQGNAQLSFNRPNLYVIERVRETDRVSGPQPSLLTRATRVDMLNQQGGAARISESGSAPLELNAASHEVRNKAHFEPHELDTGKDEPAGNQQTE